MKFELRFKGVCYGKVNGRVFKVEKKGKYSVF